MDKNAIIIALSGLGFALGVALVVVVFLVGKIRKRTNGINALKMAERGEMELKEKTQPSTVQVSSGEQSEMEEVKEEDVVQREVEEGNTQSSESKRDTVSNYEFLTVLGEGSYGRVTLAKRSGTGELFAIKAIKKMDLRDREDRLAALREKELLTLACAHPFLTALKSFFQTNGHIFFVTEYASGGTLAFHLTKSQGHKFEENKARYYAAEITSGIQFLHKRLIIHRDLKLSNILIDAEGHCKIADFGLSKRLITNRRLTGSFCGTLSYMSPEMMREEEYDFSVDYWALGIVVYIMMVGNSPFYRWRSDKKEMKEQILNDDAVHIPSCVQSDEVKNFLGGLLEKNPKNRLGCRISDGEVDEIRTHPFFKNLNWDDLEARKIEPPFIPVLSGPEDTSHFPKKFTEQDPTRTPTPIEEIEKIKQYLFKDFDSVSPFQD